MTPNEALRLIAGGETLTLEFKGELSRRQERAICKEIAALATMQGGHLLIGVEDDGKVRGVADPAEMTAKIESWVAHYVAPAPTVNFETLVIDGARVVHVDIAEGVAPLYCYDGRPYLRVGTKSAVATPAQIEHLVSTGKLVADMRANIARMVSLEKTLHPARHTAAAIFGQGELATMSYQTVRDRLFSDLRAILSRPPASK